MITCILTVLALLMPPAATVDRFAGRWTLDRSASALGADHQRPDYEIARELAVKAGSFVQADVTTNMELFGSAVPEIRSKFTLTVDGAEHVVEGLNRPPLVASSPTLPSKTTALARWDGDNFVYEARGVDIVGPWSAKHRLFITDDGARLVDAVTVVSVLGESERQYVFSRRK